MSIDALARNFVSSEEMVVIGRTVLTDANLSDTVSNSLGRAPSEEELNNNLKILQFGGTRATLMKEISLSTEKIRSYW